MYSGGEIRYVQDSGERHSISRLKPVLLIIFNVRGRVNHVESICKSRVRTRITLRLVKDTAVDEDEIT